ncbi:hypothetical protein HK097_004994, partial [Rhizophlyctis rosea]
MTTTTVPEPADVVKALKSSGLFDALRSTLLEDHKDSPMGATTLKNVETVLENHRHYIQTNPIFSASINRTATIIAANPSASTSTLFEGGVQSEIQKVRQVLDQAIKSSGALSDFSGSTKPDGFFRSDGPQSRMEEAIRAIFDQARGQADAPQRILQQYANKRTAHAEATNKSNHQHIEECKPAVAPSPASSQPKADTPARETSTPAPVKTEEPSDETVSTQTRLSEELKTTDADRVTSSALRQPVDAWGDPIPSEARSEDKEPARRQSIPDPEQLVDAWGDSIVPEKSSEDKEPAEQHPENEDIEMADAEPM